MKLNATLTSERGKEVRKTANEFITCEFTVNREPIGEIELYYSDDVKLHGTDEDEWLLKYRPNIDSDWEIIAQGNSKSKQKGRCAHENTEMSSIGSFCLDCGARL